MNKLYILILIGAILLVGTGFANSLKLKGHNGFGSQSDEYTVGQDNDDQSDQNGDIFDKLDDYDDDNQFITNEAKQCFNKILGPSMSCAVATMGHWKVSAQQMRTLLNSRSVCCAFWQMSGCFTEQAKKHCNQKERIDFLNHLSSEIERRSRKNCSNYPYVDNDCSLGLQSNGRQTIRNEMLYRRGNRFSDDTVLSRELNTPQLQQLRPHDSDVQQHIQQQNDPLDQHNDDNLLDKMQLQNDQNQADFQSMPNIDELGLANKLLDRIDKITVNQYIIDLLPLRHPHRQHRYASNRMVSKNRLQHIISEPVADMP
ncbi:uncharacterized protein LOC128958323 [Oppia nitens]|uniref:uncharacterized protein LOC128958323 n=1 Tax=Oppia nitens TaxID=1686743 RepID=UPI0023DAC153|nr:uncharacterized protein LOC128958323 [Oppia nitens]